MCSSFQAFLLTVESRFLWVRYQLDYIYGQPSTHDIEIALISLPKDMSATYHRILENINKQSPAMIALAKRALLWVFTASRPLSVEELAAAVAIETTTESYYDMKSIRGETILNACGNLLTIDRQKLVRPVHYTVQEFLSATESLSAVKSPTLHQQYQLFLPEANANIAQYSIQYMLFIEFKTFEMSRPAVEPGFYIRSYWDSHLSAAPNVMTVGLQDTLGTFLSADSYTLSLIYEDCYGSGVRDLDIVNFCLSFGILHVLVELQQFDLSTIITTHKEALHFAARGGLVSSIQTLLDLGFSVNSLDSQQVQPLYLAVEQGHRAAAKHLIDMGADINAQGGYCGNALQGAAGYGEADMVRLLLDNGANINAQGGYYGNALQAAARFGGVDVVRMLLHYGADINAQGGEYGNALQAAARFGGVDAVRILLDNGADINIQGGRFGNTLQAVAESGGVDVVRMLLDNGADINARGGQYGNPLQAAVRFGRVDVVRMFLDNGANINAQGGQYGNALQAAKDGGREDMIQLLLDNGAIIDS